MSLSSFTESSPAFTPYRTQMFGTLVLRIAGVCVCAGGAWPRQAPPSGGLVLSQDFVAKKVVNWSWRWELFHITPRLLNTIS